MGPPAWAGPIFSHRFRRASRISIMHAQEIVIPVSEVFKSVQMPFAPPASIRIGLEARSRLDTSFPLSVSNDEDKSSQGALK
jgi:hypothetical protein